jgi:septum formation protein
LQRAGINPTVIVSSVDEDAILEAAKKSSESRGAGPLLATEAKALAVVTAHNPDALVLGCDSMLEFGGDIYGKPANGVQARERWRMMRGNEGWLHTGHWLVDGRESGTGSSLGETASTRVQFAALTDEEIDEYVATGEPLKVAGAFTVDGLGGPYVTHIEGDYHNVVGLSLPLLRNLLGQLEVPIHALRSPIAL